MLPFAVVGQDVVSVVVDGLTAYSCASRWSVHEKEEEAIVSSMRIESGMGMLLVMMWKGEEIEKGVQREIEDKGAHETTRGRTRLPTRSTVPLKDCINSLSKAAAGKKTIPASTDHSGYNNDCCLIAPKSLSSF